MADLSTLDVILRVLIAAALGAIVGAEREIEGQDAGLRTHILLATGAAVFGVISIAGFPGVSDSDSVSFDPSRVASYVAPGVGFLGAGAILKNAHRVRGLTTAASLWLTAAVGLAAGIGFWVLAVAGAAAALFSLLPLKPVRNLLGRVGGRAPRIVIVSVAPDARLSALVPTLREEFGAEEISIDSADDSGRTRLRVQMSDDDAQRFLKRWTGLDAVEDTVVLSR